MHLAPILVQLRECIPEDILYARSTLPLHLLAEQLAPPEAYLRQPASQDLNIARGRLRPPAFVRCERGPYAILLIHYLDALFACSVGLDDVLEPEFANDGHARTANIDVLTLHADGGGPLEDGNAWIFRGRKRGEAQE